MLSAAISSGLAHLADAKDGGAPENSGRWGWRSKGILDDWQPQGDRIGWVEGDHLLLEPEAAFAAVQKLARDQRTHLAINSRTLWKRMAEKGLLASRDQKRQRNTVRRLIAGERKDVLHFLAGILSHLTVPTVPDPRNHAALGTEKMGRLFGDSEKPSQKNDPQAQAGQDPGTVGTVIEDKTPMDNSDLFELVAALRREGVTLSIEGGDLRVAGDLKPGMAAVIERHRSALVLLLQRGNPFED